MSPQKADPPPPPMDRVLEFLPHQPPMRLIEEVVEIQPGHHAAARRTTESNDWYFQGHFPGNPIVPAIVLVELIAQTGGIAAFADSSVPAQSDVKGARVAAFGDFKFPDAARAGDVLDVKARVAARVGKLTRIEGEVSTGGNLVARGCVTLAVTDV